MKTKNTLTALIAAAALSVAGLAVAQSTPKVLSSTAGDKCTATGNAMRAGNLGGSPSTTACNDTGNAKTAAAPAATATTDTTTSAGASTLGSSTMGNTASTNAPAPTRVARVARADRN